MEQPAVRRLSHLLDALNVQPDVLVREDTAAPAPKRDDDVVIVDAVRTPVGRAKRGNLKDTHPTDLLATVFKGLLDRTKIDPGLVQDISVGWVLAPGGGATQARMAMFLAGLPESTSISTVNRQCSSGLQACMNIAGAIKAGSIDCGIGAGVESMSLYDMMSSVGEINPKVFEVAKAAECLQTMGETSENVAEKYGISREVQDKFALESQAKAARAQKAGKFKSEITPVHTSVKGQDGQSQNVTVSEDEGPRPTTMEALAKLKPAFKPGGSTTAGNSSQTSDGAAAVLLMRRSLAKKLNLPIRARIISYAVVGVPPSIMGIGPAAAIPEALKKAGISVTDVDVFEINEAFASQASYCVEKLGIPANKVNPNGGAIALGHPLGCTGARQIATILPELERQKATYGVLSMCIGTGMGAAAVIQRE